ncbi:hypothetical protein VT03_12720 [Planctomyces sp. SH-PL14]|nr:hypothetical protein VT03_12720 [Planctomyces sp. SH-PL14]
MKEYPGVGVAGGRAVGIAVVDMSQAYPLQDSSNTIPPYHRVQGHPGGECRGGEVEGVQAEGGRESGATQDHVALIGSRGTLVRGCKGENPPCPPEACLVGYRLKESVSKSGQRAVCTLTNPRGLQSER